MASTAKLKRSLRVLRDTDVGVYDEFAEQWGPDLLDLWIVPAEVEQETVDRIKLETDLRIAEALDVDNPDEDEGDIE